MISGHHGNSVSLLVVDRGDFSPLQVIDILYIRGGVAEENTDIKSFNRTGEANILRYS
jgi:hypothetical protein